MERKTKHRILGILVVIGLVVILLPFFQTSRELPSEKMLVKAPPFPEQNTQVAEDVIANDEIESNINNTPSITPTAKPDAQQIATHSDQSTAINVDNTKVTTDEQKTENVNPTAEKTADNNAAVEKKLPESLASLADNKASNEEIADKVLDDQQVADNEPVRAAKAKPALSPLDDEPEPKIKPQQHLAAANKHRVSSREHHQLAKNEIKNKTTRTAQFVPKVIEYKNLVKHEISSTSAANTNNGLSHLKNSAWVIQLGSFKNKTKALHLVNQLRAKGYPAFIQQLDTAMGNTTRVFVGPEIKQTDARKTANHIAANMKLHGIVISYKPLTL